MPSTERKGEYMIFDDYIELNVGIKFPKDSITCYFCPLLKSENGTYRLYCTLSGEYILNEKKSVGKFCKISKE